MKINITETEFLPKQAKTINQINKIYKADNSIGLRVEQN